MTRRLFSIWLGGYLFAISAVVVAGDALGSVGPQPFAPSVVAARGGVDCATFTPDGNTVFFDREAPHSVTIMQSHRSNGHWSTPQVVPFSGTWLDHDPVVSPDGSFLVFTSNRPANAGEKPLHGGHLWRVDRRGDGWSEPAQFPDIVNATTHTFAPAIAENGDVYFQQADPPRKDFHIYRTAYRNGSYLAPSIVELGDPEAHKLDPAIAPDGSFIVFDANYAGKGQPDRLYIAFRHGDGFGAPIDMGDMLNRYQPWGSHLSPHHRTLYFTSEHALPGASSADPTAQKNDASHAAMEHPPTHIWSVSLAHWLDAAKASR